MLEKIESLTKDFFSKLQVDINSIIIEEESENIFLIKVDTPESNFLIGTHGRHLETITSILKLILIRNLGENIKIHLEVNDYLESKDKKLYKFIESKIKLVEKAGNDIQLPYLTSYERKKVHSFVSELNKNLFTKSEGEGRDRRMFIGKEKNKLTIDIDGSDI